MKSVNEWLSAYGRDHKHPVNIKIHKVCVPLILFSVLSLLWAIPTPEDFNSLGSFPLNFSTLFVFGCLLFYFALDKIFFSIMSVVALVCLTIIYFWAQQDHFLAANLAIFVLAWIGQFVGHKIEGQKPSFLEDLKFLLIGPLWVLKDLRHSLKSAVEI